jgi:ribonucleoside-diphosphate reductase alpha chain
MATEKINVLKRNGETEALNPEKIHKVLEWAINGYSGVSVSEIEIKAQLKLVDNISTREVHRALIDSARDLISLDAPNYQYVAARLLLYMLRKDVWGSREELNLYKHITNMIVLGQYDSTILDHYTKEEIQLCNDKIDHDRDYLFTFAGLQQMCDKYLVQDRITHKIFETPQLAYMTIAMTLFQTYPSTVRLQYVFKCYDYISKFKISLPTPILAGVRTPLRRYASCCLIDVDDNLASLGASNEAIFRYTASRSGIGLNMGRIRAINSSIRGGEVVHTGVIPFLKWYESCVKSCQQNGIRGGSATVHFPFWHKEIEDIITLKNNAKTGDNSVRFLDYSIGFSKLFFDRFLQNMKDKQTNPDAKNMITLFSPHEVPDLYNAWGNNELFDELYVQYENDPSIKSKATVPVEDLMKLFTKERRETARIYAHFVDHINDHSAFQEPITMSNLCQEITQPTKPLQHIDDDEAEIGICILSAINVLEIQSDAELRKVCDIVVRLLDALIDHQTYPVKAAENFTKRRRSLGVGITNLAALFAKNNLKYDELTSDAPNFVDELMEKIQYNLLLASCNLAKEVGPCEKYDLTNYAKGILPIDTYCKAVDRVVTRKPSQNWDYLRERIAKYGLRNSTLTAMMPCESSSVTSNSTNGIEPIKKFFIIKSSKSGKLPFIVPSYQHWKNKYTLQFDMKTNKGYSNITAAIQKWTDMAISCMHYYNYEHFEDNKMEDTHLTNEFIYHYKMGNKTLYYTYSNDLDKQSVTDVVVEILPTEDETILPEMGGCESGACSL